MAINCKISKGVSKDCKLRAGGIEEIALINKEDITIEESATGILTIGGTSGSDITIGGDANTKFLVYQVADQSTSATSTIQVGSSRDVKSLLHTVTGTLVGFPEDIMGDEFTNIVLSNVVIAVKETSGDVWIYGATNGLRCDNFDYTTGASNTDLNGVTFTFSGTQMCAPYRVDKATGATGDVWTILKSLTGPSGD